MDQVGADIRLALRGMLRSPVATGAAVVSLALGIAAVTVIFSVLDATLWRAIPGTNRPDLVRIQGDDPQAPVLPVSYPEYLALRDETGAFSGLAAERVNAVAATVGGSARSLGGAVVSRDYFDVASVPMSLGRGFSASDDRAAPDAVISHDLWDSSFGARRDVLGETVRSGGVEFTIVGVAGEGFQGAFPGFRVQLWLPVEYAEAVMPGDGSLDAIGDRFLNLVGVLAPGLEPDAAHARLDVVAGRLADDPAFGASRTFRVAPATGVHPSLKPIAATVLGALLAIAGTVLAIACANVANVLLARAQSRASDFACRIALGASRGRIVQQQLVESLALGTLGAVAGATLSAWAVRSVAAVQPPAAVPIGLEVGLEVRGLVFAIGVGLAAGVVSGLLSALRGSTTDLAERLRASSTGGRSGAGWTGRTLVASQVAVTSVLLVGAALMVRSVGRLPALDAGFERDAIVTVRPDLTQYEEVGARAYWNEAIAAVESVPGIEDAALGLFAHLGGRADQMPAGPGDAEPGTYPLGRVNYSIVDADLMAVLGIEMTAGRGFASEDVGSDAEAVVVNGALASRAWPGGSALGRTLRVVDRTGTERDLRVIGVTETVKYRSLNEDPTPFFYLPYSAWYRRDMIVHARLRAPAEAPIEAIRARLEPLDPDVPLSVARMTDDTTVTVVLARVLRVVLVASGLVGLLIASFGIFGLVSFVTERRVREIAIRMAVGARARDAEQMVVGQSLVTVAAGLVLGLVAALVLARALSAFLYGVSPLDALSLSTTGGVVLVAAALAAWLPARRVTRAVDLAASLGAE